MARLERTLEQQAEELPKLVVPPQAQAVLAAAGADSPAEAPTGEAALPQEQQAAARRLRAAAARTALVEAVRTALAEVAAHPTVLVARLRAVAHPMLVARLRAALVARNAGQDPAGSERARPRQAQPLLEARRKKDKTCWWAGWLRHTACRRS